MFPVTTGTSSGKGRQVVIPFPISCRRSKGDYFPGELYQGIAFNDLVNKEFRRSRSKQFQVRLKGAQSESVLLVDDASHLFVDSPGGFIAVLGGRFLDDVQKLPMTPLLQSG